MGPGIAGAHKSVQVAMSGVAQMGNLKNFEVTIPRLGLAFRLYHKTWAEARSERPLAPSRVLVTLFNLISI